MRPLEYSLKDTNFQDRSKHSCHFHRFLITQHVLCSNSLVARCSIFACKIWIYAPTALNIETPHIHRKHRKWIVLSGMSNIRICPSLSTNCVWQESSVRMTHLLLVEKGTSLRVACCSKAVFWCPHIPRILCLFKIQIFSPLICWETRPMSLCRCKESTWVINCEWTGAALLLNELHPLVLFLLTSWCCRNQSKQQ